MDLLLMGSGVCYHYQNKTQSLMSIISKQGTSVSLRMSLGMVAMLFLPSLRYHTIAFLSISTSMRTEVSFSTIPIFDLDHLLLLAICPVLKLNVMLFFLLQDSSLSFYLISITPIHMQNLFDSIILITNVCLPERGMLQSKTICLQFIPSTFFTTLPLIQKYLKEGIYYRKTTGILLHYEPIYYNLCPNISPGLRCALSLIFTKDLQRGTPLYFGLNSSSSVRTGLFCTGSNLFLSSLVILTCSISPFFLNYSSLLQYYLYLNYYCQFSQSSIGCIYTSVPFLCFFLSFFFCFFSIQF